MTEEEVAALHEQYKHKKKKKIRNMLVMNYSYIAKTAAMQLRGLAQGYAQIEDMVSHGMMTLIDCIDKYEEEIGASDRIIMFVIPSYFKSIECMYEMTQMFLNGKVRERIIRLVDIEGIQRNGDGLSEIKDYWQGEKARKAQRMVDEPGGSRFISMEIRKIDEIIRTLDDLWFFICRDSTGDYKKLIENDAELLIEELKNTLSKVEVKIDEKFVLSGDTQPSEQSLL